MEEAVPTKEIMDKLEYIKIRNFCSSKDAIKRVKGDRGEENIKIYIFIKELQFRLYKEC